MLEYQSSSRYTVNKNPNHSDSRAKVKTQYEDLYSLPESGVRQSRQEAWGVKPADGKFLGQR